MYLGIYLSSGMVLELWAHITPLSGISLANNCKSAGKDSMAKALGLYRYHFFSIGEATPFSQHPSRHLQRFKDRNITTP